MDCLFEFFGELILAPIFYLFCEVPFTACNDAIEESKLSKRRKGLMHALIALIFVLIFASIITGAVLLGIGESMAQIVSGTVLLCFGAALFVGYFVFAVVCLRIVLKNEKRKASARTPDSSILGKTVHVVIDRPLGSTHPEHSDIVYGVNYGFVPEYIGGDGEAQDAYVLGVDTPVSEFDGTVTAIIHRLDDNEDKLVVVSDGVEISDDEIINNTYFQEQYFEIKLIRLHGIHGDKACREQYSNNET